MTLRHPIASLLLAVAALTAPAIARAAPFNPVEATIADIQKAYANGTLTPEKLVQMYRHRIAALDQSDEPQPFGNGLSDQPLNSFMHVNKNAKRDARTLQENPQLAGKPLFGIPIILKDNIATADMPTTAGSVALGNSRPAKDATITARLRQAGAIILGKGTLTEFANFLTNGMPSGYSSQLRFQIFFHALGSDSGKIGYGYDPYDTRLDTRADVGAFDGRPAVTPGGSSSGPGIAVSANLATVGVGTETSGSILSPASANMLVGIKPTVGLVSRHGILPITVDQDTAGPLARTVTDAAKLLGVLAGFDPKDPATAECLTAGNCLSDYTPFLDKHALSGAKIAVPRNPFFTAAFGLTPNRAAVMSQAMSDMAALGATLVDCDIPSQSALNRFGTCTTQANVNARRANTGPNPAPCSTVLLNGFKNDLNAYLADPDFGPGVSVTNSTVATLSDVRAYNSAHPEFALKYGQIIADAADSLGSDPALAQRDVDNYKADRAFDLLLTRTCGLEIMFTGHVPTGQNGETDCRPFIQDWLNANAAKAANGGTSCVGMKFDALIFPANFGANAPARGGYPSVAVPAGKFQFTTVFPGFPDPPFSPIDATFTGPRFSEGKLIGFAFAFEQATLHPDPNSPDGAKEMHRVAPPDPKLP